MNRKLLVCLRSALALAILFTSGRAYSAEPNNDLKVESEASTACFASFVHARLTVCVTDHGNIVRFESPAGAGHVKREGYAVCAAFTSPFPPPSPPPAMLAAYDAATGEGGWVGPPSIEQINGPNTLPLKIQRVTNTGLLLTQTFARDTSQRDFTITMNLYAPPGVTRYDVRLDRYFDGDVFNTASSDRYDKGLASVWAVQNGTFGVILTDVSATTTPQFAPAVATAVHSFAPCQKGICGQTSGATPTAAGDYVGRISFAFGTIAGPTSRTVIVNYRRM